MNNLIRGLLVVLLFACVVGCDHKPKGKYTSQGGLASIEFKSGKAVLSSELGGNVSETDDYTVDGNTITVKSHTGDVKFTIMQDGSLEGALGTFKKAAD